jgi:hypothetical protein
LWPQGRGGSNPLFRTTVIEGLVFLDVESFIRGELSPAAHGSTSNR